MQTRVTRIGGSGDCRDGRNATEYNLPPTMRYVYLILFAIVLGLPFAVRRVAMPGQAAAPEEKNSPRLIIVTVHNGDIRREFALAFDAWHRSHFGSGVVLDFRVPGGTSDMVRFLQGRPTDPQVVWGGGDYTFYHDLQPKGILQPIHLDPRLFKAAFPGTLAGVRLYDGTRMLAASPRRNGSAWCSAVLASFTIRSFIGRSDLPLAAKPGQDLTDPKLFD